MQGDLHQETHDCSLAETRQSSTVIHRRQSVRTEREIRPGTGAHTWAAQLPTERRSSRCFVLVFSIQDQGADPWGRKGEWVMDSHLSTTLHCCCRCCCSTAQQCREVLTGYWVSEQQRSAENTRNLDSHTAVRYSSLYLCTKWWAVGQLVVKWGFVFITTIFYWSEAITLTYKILTVICLMHGFC